MKTSKIAVLLIIVLFLSTTSLTEITKGETTKEESKNIITSYPNEVQPSSSDFSNGNDDTTPPIQTFESGQPKIDSCPPKTTIAIGQPQYGGQWLLWVSNTTPIWFNATDQGCSTKCSGVESLNITVYWKRNINNQNEPWILNKTITVNDNEQGDNNPEYGKINYEFHFDDGCCHKLKWYAIDKKGNIEPENTRKFKVDVTPPSIKVDIGNPNNIIIPDKEYYITKNTSINISARDHGCMCGVGLSTFEYNIFCSGAWNGWSAANPIHQPIEFLEEGLHYLLIRAIDNLGNMAEKNITFIVDESIPTNNPPNTPSNPSPANETTNVDINAGLNWIGGDPDPQDTVTYNVYFGTTSPPVLVSTGQFATTYDLPTLEYGMIYYWQIVSWDNHGASTPGPLWSFTTEQLSNQPPYTPNDPSPANDATDIDITTDLSWSGGDPDSGDATSYDVYFGTDNPPPLLSEDQLGTTYDLHLLSYDTTYFWQIISWDEHGATTSGPLWHFTTMLSNHPPNVPSNPNPIDDATNVGIYTDLWWTGGDLDQDDIVTYNVYFWITNPPLKVSDNQTETTYNPGELQHNIVYYWQIIAMDNFGAITISPIWTFTTTNMPNYSPNKPTTPQPENGATNLEKNVILSVFVSDTNGDSLNVSFYNANNNQLIGSTIVPNGSIASKIWSNLQLDTTYSWYAIVNDTVLSNTSDTWNFKTRTPVSTPGEQQNYPPIADLSKGEPYQGFIDEDIFFDGSLSHDIDGTIVSYKWNFGDGTSSSGETTTHSYSEAGTFPVTLTVIDNTGKPNSDTTSAIISIPNRPPNQPVLDGPEQGSINISYTYTTVTTDLDNDSLQYFFNWDDGETQNSSFLPSDTPFIQNHTWTTAGRFAVSVYAYDNKTESQETTLIVLINAQYVGNLGYLLDVNNDGIYDHFHSNSTGQETRVNKTVDGNYLIDTNGDGKWDTLFNIHTGEISSYTEQPKETEPSFEANQTLLILAGILILLFLILFILIAWKKAKKTQEEKPVVEESAIPAKEQPTKKTVEEKPIAKESAKTKQPKKKSSSKKKPPKKSGKKTK